MPCNLLQLPCENRSPCIRVFNQIDFFWDAVKRTGEHNCNNSSEAIFLNVISMFVSLLWLIVEISAATLLWETEEEHLVMSSPCFSLRLAVVKICVCFCMNTRFYVHAALMAETHLWHLDPPPVPLPHHHRALHNTPLNIKTLLMGDSGSDDDHAELRCVWGNRERERESGVSFWVWKTEGGGDGGSRAVISVACHPKSPWRFVLYAIYTFAT